VVSAADRVTHFLVGGDRALADRARQALAEGAVVALSLADGAEPLLDGLKAAAPILPVHHTERPGRVGRRAYVVAGALLPADSPAEAVRAELARVAADLDERLARHEPLEHEASGH
jgi:hypothetical protein